MKTKSRRRAATASSGTSTTSMQAAQEPSPFVRRTNALTSNYGERYNSGIALVRKDGEVGMTNLTAPCTAKSLSEDLIRCEAVIKGLMQHLKNFPDSDRNTCRFSILQNLLKEAIPVVKDSMADGSAPKVLAGIIGLGHTPTRNKKTNEIEVQVDDQGRQIVDARNPFANFRKAAEQAISMDDTKQSIAVAFWEIIQVISQSKLTEYQKHQRFIDQPTPDIIDAFAQALVDLTMLLPSLPIYLFFLTKTAGVAVVKKVETLLRSPAPASDFQLLDSHLFGSNGLIMAMVAVNSHPRVLVGTKPTNKSQEEGIVVQELVFLDDLLTDFGFQERWRLMSFLSVNDNLPMVSIHTVKTGLLQTLYANWDVDEATRKLAAVIYSSFTVCADKFKEQEELVQDMVLHGQPLELHPEPETISQIFFNAEVEKYTNGAERRRQRAPQNVAKQDAATRGVELLTKGLDKENAQGELFTKRPVEKKSQVSPAESTESTGVNRERHARIQQHKFGAKQEPATAATNGTPKKSLDDKLPGHEPPTDWPHTEVKLHWGPWETWQKNNPDKVLLKRQTLFYVEGEWEALKEQVIDYRKEQVIDDVKKRRGHHRRNRTFTTYSNVAEFNGKYYRVGGTFKLEEYDIIKKSGELVRILKDGRKSTPLIPVTDRSRLHAALDYGLRPEITGSNAREVCRAHFFKHTANVNFDLIGEPFWKANPGTFGRKIKAAKTQSETTTKPPAAKRADVLSATSHTPKKKYLAEEKIYTHVVESKEWFHKVEVYKKPWETWQEENPGKVLHRRQQLFYVDGELEALGEAIKINEKIEVEDEKKKTITTEEQVAKFNGKYYKVGGSFKLKEHKFNVHEKLVRVLKHGRESAPLIPVTDPYLHAALDYGLRFERTGSNDMQDCRAHLKKNTVNINFDLIGEPFWKANPDTFGRRKTKAAQA